MPSISIENQYRLLKTGLAVFVCGCIAIFGYALYKNFFFNIPRHFLVEEENVQKIIEKCKPFKNIKDSSGQTIISIIIEDVKDDDKAAEIIEQLIQNGFLVNIHTNKDSTPLIDAIKKERAAVVKVLIANGADIHLSNKNGETPYRLLPQSENPDINHIYTLLHQNGWTPELGGIYKTITENDKKSIELLLQRKNLPLDSLLMCASGFATNTEVISRLYKAGANINCKDIRGWTPITYAVSYNSNLKILFGLVQLGAKINKYDSFNNSALYIAIKNNEPSDVIYALLQAGANPNKQNDEGTSAIDLARELNITENLNLLLRPARYNYSESAIGYISRLGELGNTTQIKEFLRCNPETDKELLLFALVTHNKDPRVVSDIIKYLKVNLNIRDGLGKTPIFYAIQNQQSLAKIQLLVNLGANILVTDLYRNNLLTTALSNNVSFDIVKYLIEKGVPTNGLNQSNETALMLTIKNYKNEKDINFIAQKSKEQINCLSISYKTAMHYAIEKNCPTSTLEIIKNNGAIIDNTLQATTPLLFTAIKNNSSSTTLKWLIENGAIIEEANEFGQTPLIYAIEEKNEIAAHTLLLLNANPNHSSPNGTTPLTSAINNNASIKLFRNLIFAGAKTNLKINDLTPIQLAQSRKRYDVMKLFFEAGEDFNIHDALGETIAYKIVKMNDIESVKSFIQAGVDFELSNEQSNIRPLQQAQLNNSQEMIQLLESYYNNAFRNAGGIFSLLSKTTVDELKKALKEYNGTYESLLQCAVTYPDNINIVKYLISCGADINYENSIQMTALQYAIMYNGNDYELIDYLINRGAKINNEQKKHQSILTLAINSKCDPSVISLLIKKGANTTDKDKFGKSVLQNAILQNYDIDILSAIINKNADLKATDKLGRNALFYAIVYNENSQTLQFLIDQGISRQHNINISDINPEIKDIDLISLAIYFNKDIEFIKILLRNDCDPNYCGETGRTPISYAAQYCENEEIFNYLLQFVTDPNKADNDKNSPLMYAAKDNKNGMIFDAILEICGKKSLFEENNLGFNAIYYAIAVNNCEDIVYSISNHVDLSHQTDKISGIFTVLENHNELKILETLISLGANINTPNGENQTPLSFAITNKCSNDIVYFLISQNANIDNTGNDDIEKLSFLLLRNDFLSLRLWEETIKNYYPKTLSAKTSNAILCEAIKTYDAEYIVKYLLEIGVKPTHLNKAELSPLMIAIQNNKTALASKILECEVDVNSKTINGETAIWIALRSQNLQILERLLQLGANPNELSTNGDIPIYYAAKNKFEEAALILLEHGANINQDNKNKLSILAQNNELIKLKEQLTKIYQSSYQAKTYKPYQYGQKQIKDMTKEDAVNTLFYEIANGGNLKRIEQLLKITGTSTIDNFQKSPLYYAIKLQKENALIQLILKNIDIETKNDLGENSFLQITQDLGVKEIEKIINKTKNINIKDNNQRNALHIAIKNHQNCEVIKVLLKNKININDVDLEGYTPIARAIETEQLDIVEVLLNSGANIKLKTLEEQTLMHLAAKSKKQQLIELLMLSKLDINAVDSSGNTPIMIAAMNNNKNTVQSLVIANADQRKTNKEGDTAISLAIKNNASYDLIITLLAGGSLNKYPKNAPSPLLLALKKQSSIDIIEALLLSHADPTGGVKTIGHNAPILEAAKNSSPEIIVRLLEAGADITVRNQEGESSLTIAIKNNNNKIQKLLYQIDDNKYQIPDINIYNSIAKQSLEQIKEVISKEIFIPWDSLLLCALQNNRGDEIIQYLLNRGASPKTKSLLGTTPLMIAIQNNNLDITNILIMLGADIFTYDASGNNAIDFAHNSRDKNIKESINSYINSYFLADLPNTKNIKNFNKKILSLPEKNFEKFINQQKDTQINQLLVAAIHSHAKTSKIKLIANKENVSKPIFKDMYAIHLAISNNNTLSVIKQLLEKGSDINQQTQEGHTPLMLAIKNNSPAAIINNLLRIKKLDLEIQDENGFTALTHAVLSNRSDFVQTIINMGGNTKIIDNYGNSLLEIARKNKISLEIITLISTNN